MLDKTIILDGFSKTYAMTGWRLGYGVMPEWLVEAVSKLMVNSNSCTASFTQRAGIAALTGPQDSVDERRAIYERRRDRALAALEGIEAQSEGTFFVWFRLPEGVTVDQLLVEHRVAVAPGEGFGARGAGWARLSLAVSDEILDRGLERLRGALG